VEFGSRSTRLPPLQPLRPVRSVAAQSTDCRGGVMLVDDSYNSSPSALKRALDVIAKKRAPSARSRCSERCSSSAPSATELHRDAGAQPQRPGLDALFVVGGEPAASLGDGRDCRGDASASVTVLRSSATAAPANRSGNPQGRCRPREGLARHTDGPDRGSDCGGIQLMLLYLLYPLHTYATIFNVTRYITFRTAAASLTALALSLALGPWMIRKLRDFQIGQVIRQEGPQSHRAKAGTPTMGGLLILTSALVPTLLWADLSNPYVWIAVLATAAFGGVGFTDDYLKIVRRSHHGLLPRYKMGGQIVVALAVGVAVLFLSQQNPPLYNTRLIFPFFKI
jgi:hypothetical protein